ncbi:hypothetical protein K7472_20630 [Streptomyces sp. PTM05]|uniref:Uncharacterized protein n=1 Tax=Streptantibioticus parmotrematis TaxID=2873249 RepID=A0ABS7QY12_9ACTN|nr:hypothetical protein [Streptantibioticus parmotrematis]MBY8887235.1 hypothetical protein [Streptantibioticus parmotrematis]
MTTYHVSWTNEDIDAEDPLSAAREAWDMLRDPEAFPPVFEVGAGSTVVEVDLLDDAIRPASSHAANDLGAGLIIGAYLATYPYPLPDLDTTTARVVRADQVRQGDVLLSAFKLNDRQLGHATLKAHIPRYADPSPACGTCSPDCAAFALHAQHGECPALHMTAIGREVTDPEECDDEPFHLNDFADTLYLIVPHSTRALETAGRVLRAALAERNVTVHEGTGPYYAIPLDPATPAQEVYHRAHLSVADRNTSTEHDSPAHTGWTVFLRDDNGESVGEPLYIAGDGEVIDCTVESAAAAAFIAGWLTAHQRPSSASNTQD